MNDGRKALHPEYVEAMEVNMDRLMPGQAPVLFVHGELQDPRRVLATIPDLEQHKLYLGRLVSVEVAEGSRRQGSVEAIDGHAALVRYVDWDD
jgi:hypothetical protein